MFHLGGQSETTLNWTFTCVCILITPIIPFSEGGLLVYVSGISEGDTRFPYTMNLVSPKE